MSESRSDKYFDGMHPDCGNTRKPLKSAPADDHQMISETLQQQASAYAAGTMTASEREQFELILEFQDEVREFVAGLAEVAAAVTLATLPSVLAQPAAGIRARLLARLADHPQQTSVEGFVVCGPDRLVHWVNPAFTAMCGYSLDELRGKNLGPILQGAKTDRETSARMRSAVKAYQPCRETILNYHKNGDPYWVEIAITPIFDDAGAPLWLVARERELVDQVAT